MKKITIFLVALMFSLAAFSQSVEEPKKDSIPETIQVLDSTIRNDIKLLVIADRLYAKNGLMELLSDLASKEKAETDTIKNLADIQAFVDFVDAKYKNLLTKFIKVDTVSVSPQYVTDKIAEITTWKQQVLADPEIKNVTTLSVWDEKEAELAKLLQYDKQLKKLSK